MFMIVVFLCLSMLLIPYSVYGLAINTTTTTTITSATTTTSTTTTATTTTTTTNTNNDNTLHKIKVNMVIR